MIDPLRAPFEAGEADRRGPHAVAQHVATLVTVCVICTILAGLMAADAGSDPRLVESPVPVGPWAIGWGERVAPPPAEQAEQVASLREVAAGSASLVALLALMIAVGVWRQRLRLRRAEDYVHWAAGARRTQLAARLIGEGWRWGALALIASLVVSYAVPRAIEDSFPGAADVPPGLASALIVLTGVAAVLLRWETTAGRRSAHAGVRSRSLASSPTAVAAVGFTVLTGVGLLSRHAPGSAPREDAAGLVTYLSLRAISADRRPETVVDWIERASPSPAVAAAGATRGTGYRAEVWVNCGDCYEGGLPLPIRTVVAEVHAVAADTFPHLGLRVLRGRDFDNRGDRGVPDVAIVNRALAARHFEGGEALGRRIRIGDTDWLTVVGVVSDAADARDHGEYAVYLPLTQAAPSEIEAFGTASAEVMGAWVEAAPAGATATAPRTVTGVFAMHGWFARLMRLLGALAYLLVLIGVWLGSRNEARATAFELALRRAVGARRRDLLTYFASSAGRRLAIAFGAGAWLSLFLGAGLNDAYGTIPQIDWLVWLRAGALVCVAWLVGAWPPFAGARRLAPVVGLRGR